ncbi:unnamed protein product [Vitrella brassicaformis CCMP3155]|uniref:endo-1,4-beta-xylanase n=1 Tax=Vitrella brassicaformis (strain CCMP3155) TaxID=1169540 RepID=A0A0G4ER04_VITBC|nr:unnamed protein product [Vitrella brassicaformis CCMP3155]|eukprot:CEL99914.1 unnamed protein product [Vitrella brassicaformis CCMP3155]
MAALFFLLVTFLAGAYADNAVDDQGAARRSLKVPKDCFTPGKDYIGFDVQAWRDTSSVDHCQSKCQALPECAVFNYRDNEKQCWLKSAAALATASVDDSGALTGPKTCFPDCYEEGVTYDSRIVLRVLDVLTTEACQHLCAKRSDCKAFTFVPEQTQCKLHASEFPKSEQTGGALAISGPEKCPGVMDEAESAVEGSEGASVTRPILWLCPPPLPEVPGVLIPLSGSPQGGITQFQLTTTKESFIKPGDSEAGTLRALADNRKLYIGSAINTAHMNNGQYTSILAEQYNMAVAEWECKHTAIAPNANTINWNLCDRIADFCQDNGMGFRYHALAWYFSLPGWFKGLNPNDKRNALTSFTERVIDHYVDRVLWWDVANEAMDDNQPDGGQTPRYRSDGALYPAIPDWVSHTFHVASRALSAKNKPFKLYYNDYGVASMDGWSRGKSNAMYNMVRGLQRDGVIDGVGFQLHINTYYDLVDGVRKNIQRYGELGLEVQFTELDVGCGEWRAPTGEMVGGDRWVPCADWGDAQASRQASVYSALMAVCLDEPNCTAYVMWGFTDRHTWLTNSRPLLYDENYNKKPAWWALRDMLRDYGV